jgi:hypothetical protein
MLTGLFTSLGIILIKEVIENKWNNAEEIELITNKKVLGIIPWIKTPNFVQGNIIKDNGSVMNIAYGNIAANIVSATYPDKSKVLSFISSAFERSKSTIIPNITINLARLGRSVVLFSSDFENPHNHLKEFDVINLFKRNIIDLIEEINNQIRSENYTDEQELFEKINDVVVPIFSNPRTYLKNYDDFDSSTQDIIGLIREVNSQIKSKNYTDEQELFEKINNVIVPIFNNPQTYLKEFGVVNTSRRDIIDLIEEINRQLMSENNIDEQELLEKINDVIIPVQIKLNEEYTINFYYLCTNKIIENNYVYIASRGYAEIIKALKKKFDYVLVDAPKKPHVFPELSIISQISDASALFSSIKTNKRHLINIIKNFEKLNVKVLGIIPRIEDSQLEEHFKKRKLVKKIAEPIRV